MFKLLSSEINKYCTLMNTFVYKWLELLWYPHYNVSYPLSKKMPVSGRPSQLPELRTAQCAMLPKSRQYLVSQSRLKQSVFSCLFAYIFHCSPNLHFLLDSVGTLGTIISVRYYCKYSAKHRQEPLPFTVQWR